MNARYGIEFENVEINALDGIVLKAWYVRPHKANGSDVLMLHGVADNREGVAGLVAPLLARGYCVLLPDSRALTVTVEARSQPNGLRESDDIHRWLDWLYAGRKSKCVYGFGESMGAALVLDSLSVEERFLRHSRRVAFFIVPLGGLRTCRVVLRKKVIGFEYTDVFESELKSLL